MKVKMEEVLKYYEELIAKGNINVSAQAVMEVNVLEKMARNNHEAWRKAKIADGYTYATETNDDLKQSKLLVEWDQLPESVKEDNRHNAKETLRLLSEIGYVPIAIDDMVMQIAEQLHDSWALNKIRQGYVYGPNRNDDETKGPKTHRDILPFKVLLELYPEDAAYDLDTARGIVEEVIRNGFVFAKVS